ncbi:MAG TPA: hypothetical protein VJC06_03940 [Candidatus Paceibacterota bacterium]
MHLRLPPPINKTKDNIFKILSPYFLMYKYEDFMPEPEKEEKAVVFFGANFKDLPGADWDKFVEITNKSLGYVRRECAGYKLYYKPHPAETDEFKLVNLSGFEITKDTSIAEFYLWKNGRNIKYTFSTCSGANISAYYMGFNSYVFRDLLRSAIDEETDKGYMEYFKNMPASFCINDLNQKLTENKTPPGEDLFLEKEFGDLFRRDRGKIWFTIGDPNYLVNVLILTSLAKKINPSKKINLIIMKHHRWNVMNSNDFKSYFDEVYFFPRIFYSLRSQKIIKAIKTAYGLIKLKVSLDDIIIGVSYTSFTENCLISYNKRNYKVAILPQATIDFCCSSSIFNNGHYRTRRSVFWWSNFLEPILGLKRTIFFEDKRRIGNFTRFKKPLNDVYDKIYALQAY